jgi:hypothetical protein
MALIAMLGLEDMSTHFLQRRNLETWVLTDEIIQLLTSFHHGIARKLTGRYPHPTPDTEDWIHPSIQEMLQIAGLFPMEEYLKRRRGYLEQYVQQQQLQILQDCQNAMQTEHPTRRIFWWNQQIANTIQTIDTRQLPQIDIEEIP